MCLQIGLLCPVAIRRSKIFPIAQSSYNNVGASSTIARHVTNAILHTILDGTDASVKPNFSYYENMAINLLASLNLGRKPLTTRGS